MGKSIEKSNPVCHKCGKEISQKEYQLAIDFGQTPYCSQYCFEIDNGAPMPVSQGALIFDKIFNQNDASRTT